MFVDCEDHLFTVSTQPTQKLNIEVTLSRHLSQINFPLKSLLLLSFHSSDWNGVFRSWPVVKWEKYNLDY